MADPAPDDGVDVAPALFSLLAADPLLAARKRTIKAGGTLDVAPLTVAATLGPVITLIGMAAAVVAGLI